MYHQERHKKTCAYEFNCGPYAMPDVNEQEGGELEPRRLVEMRVRPEQSVIRTNGSQFLE